MGMTAAIAGVVVSVASAVTSAVVGGVAAEQQNRQARANAAMESEQMEHNRRLEEREAAVLEAESSENARRQRLESERLKAMQRAALGKSGAAVASGSPLAILGETAADEELKIQDVHRFGYRAAERHRGQANIFEYQGRVARTSVPSSNSLGLTIAGHTANVVGAIGQAGISASKGAK